MAWATVKAFDAAPAPPGATLKGGGSRTTGRVKALARCASIALHTFPSLSAEIRRAAPVLGEKAGLALGRARDEHDVERIERRVERVEGGAEFVAVETAARGPADAALDLAQIALAVDGGQDGGGER